MGQKEDYSSRLFFFFCGLPSVETRKQVLLGFADVSLHYLHWGCVLFYFLPLCVGTSEPLAEFYSLTDESKRG